MIDYDFINFILGRFEGKGFTRGYIPCQQGTWFGGSDPSKGAPLGVSGVTIATGVDLGQQSKARLSSMGISATTVSILAPYIGLKQDQAVEKLRETPLTITEAQVREIDEAVSRHYIHDTARMFGQEIFEIAPKEVQAVAASLCYQFGLPRRDASPALNLAWEAMREGKYQEAAAHLSAPVGWSTSHQQFMNRRRQEAELLLKVI
jgi:GH24 family phage-related lysozyme (muramidase)